MKYKNTNIEFEKLIYIIGAIVTLYLAYSAFPRTLTIVPLAAAAIFLIRLLIKDPDKQYFLQVPAFIICGVFLLSRGYTTYTTDLEKTAKYIIQFIAGGYFCFLPVFYVARYWVLSTSYRNRFQSHKKRERSERNFGIRVSKYLLEKDCIEAEISNNTKLKMIGYIGGCDVTPPFDLIGVITKDNMVVPFRLQSPLVISEIDSVPIVSLCLTHIGFNLKMLSGHRDWSPSYDETIFLNNEFHGYEFKSKDEYKEIKQEISNGIKQLFIQPSMENKPLAYCAEVCFWGKEWPYEYPTKDTPNYKLETGSIYPSTSNYIYEGSNYRSLFLLCGYLDEAVGSTKLNARIYDYFAERRMNKQYKMSDKIIKDAKNGKDSPQLALAKGLSTFGILQEKNRHDVKEWAEQHDIRKLSGAVLLEEYKKWETEGKNPDFKREILKIILLKNRKIVEDVATIKEKAVEDAKVKARLLISA